MGAGVLLTLKLFQSLGTCLIKILGLGERYGKAEGELLPLGLGRLAVSPVPNNSPIQYSSLSYYSHCVSLRNTFISVCQDNCPTYFKAIKIVSISVLFSRIHYSYILTLVLFCLHVPSWRMFTFYKNLKLVLGEGD